MNQSHLPRSLIILLFILVAVTFITGILRTFAPAHAATILENPVQKDDPPSADGITPTSTSIADFSPPGPTPTPPPASFLPPPTEDATFMSTPPPTFTPSPPPISEQGYADTTGIIALCILLVVVILVGMAWGGHTPRKKSEPKE